MTKTELIKQAKQYLNKDAIKSIALNMSNGTHNDFIRKRGQIHDYLSLRLNPSDNFITLMLSYLKDNLNLHLFDGVEIVEGQRNKRRK